MKEGKRRFRLHAGTASILLVFVTLCLVSFAVLSLSGANADLRLSKKIAERNTAYYEALNSAVRLIGETDLALKALYEASADDADFLARAAEAFGQDTITETWPLSETQHLRIMAKAATPEEVKKANPDTFSFGNPPQYLIVTACFVETDTEALETEIEEDFLNLPH